MLYCKLRKVLYGCVQMSKLWYEKLRSFLERDRYACCDTYPCVLRKTVGEHVYMLIVYIDDILACAREKDLESRLS